ncbi:peptide synthase [compost metagenome]
MVAVVETVPPVPKAGPADPQLAGHVRRSASQAGVEVNAVLVVPTQPTDIRHNAKIDRTRLARWASQVLAGGRPGKP